MRFQDLSAGQLQALVQRVNGADTVLRILRGELTVVLNSAEPKPLPVWRTLEIGGVSKSMLPSVEREAGFHLEDSARFMMQQPAFRVLEEKTTLSLGCCTPRELGFTGDEVMLGALVLRLLAHGADVCPPEVAVYLSFALNPMSDHDHFNVIMQPIDGQPGRPSIFSLYKPSLNRQELRGRIGAETSLINCDTKVVFVVHPNVTPQ